MHPPVDQGELEENLERAAQLLAAAGRVAVLTGAGVSAESGLATFRGQGGLWEGEPVESVATPDAFQRDPARVWRFYHQRRAQRLTVQPNPGHYALVRIEKRFGPDQFTLITQNVDRLHQEAGSQHVLEVHGNLDEVRCTQCQEVHPTGFQPLPDLPRCESCGGLLRPAVVWFREMLPEDVWRQAAQAVSQCECLLVIGTSAIVYPAAGLIDMALRLGEQVIEVNLLPARVGNQGILGLYGPSGVLLPQLEQRSAAIAAERKP